MNFTGGTESPWWNDTMAVMIEGESGVVLYGEIAPSPHMVVGTLVLAGDLVGTVLRVLKKNKGLPTTMLHMELYCPGTKAPVWWIGGPQPKELQDPTELMIQCEG
jgi:hypothetical protein